MASSSSIIPSSMKKHDVFLSCSDEGSPYSFATHLYDVLLENKINTFIDDRRLRREDEISPDLCRAIEGSQISLIIFSKDYADSRLCLDELVKIIECREKNYQIVIPVYYDIRPSEVRNQIGPFADAFKKHEAHKSVQKWRNALRQAADITGFNLQFSNSEAALTRDIVNYILNKLERFHIEDEEEAIHDDIREEDSGHEDEEAIPDDNVDTQEEEQTIVNIRELYSSHEDEEPIHDPKRFQWITAERIFVATNLILEVLSVAFDEVSSVHKPQYALVSMLLSFTIMLICIIQLVHQGRRGGVGWKRKGKIPWLYYPPSDKPFGTVIDFSGLLCAIFQSIFAAVDYAYINDPIKITNLWPLVFSFCLACSTFFKESPKEEASTELQPLQRIMNNG